MANVIKLKRSSVPGKVPSAGDLIIGEMAVNTADGTLYTKHTDGSIKKITGTQFVVSASQPTGAKSGEFWYNSTSGILYIYVDTGLTAFYLDISSVNTGYTGSAGADGIIGRDGYTGSQGVVGYTGSVGLFDWLLVTTNRTTADRERLILDSSVGTFTLTLPANPTVGTYVQVTDGANLAINSVILDRNGSTIENLPNNLVLDVPNATFEFIYTGSTWQVTSTAGPKGDAGYTGSAGLSDWAVVNSTRTAADRERLIIDTSSGPFTLTLPAAPAIGTYIQLTDGANLQSNPLTIARNGSTIEGLADDLLMDVPNATFEFIYTGTTWQVTSTAGPRGEAGYIGSIGYTGSVGDIGATGPQGIQGTTGYTGSTGTQGLQGDVGATGPAGNTGATGATGPIGAAGTDGYTGSQGATGEQGASIRILGSVALVADLPPSGNLQNDAYIVDADGDLYVWTGSAWSSVGQIVGPTGPQGIQGTTGYTGSTGTQGLQGDVGATGPQGNTGATGATGPIGATGTTGYTGSQGNIGATGVAGANGFTGSQGNLGYTGSTGSTGATGPQGVQGEIGYTGSTGTFSGNTDSAVNINNATVSTSTTTGALIVAGGVGVSGNIVATSVYTEALFYANGTPFVPSVAGMSNILYVAKNGNDSNSGTINAPFLTIKAALQAAVQNSSVFVAPGTYTEDNPLTVPAKVSLKGDDLRAVTIVPQNPTSDLFYVTNASYVWGITIKDYAANGFAYDPATTTQNVFVSPYIQNVTSTTTAATATAVKIDGNLVSSISTKAMILGFFTIINRGGKGVHLINQAYSQAVNIYTIATDVGILAESGSFITLNGSDNSIGNYGLKAIGKGPEALSGTTFGTSISGVFLIRGLAAQPKVNQTMTIDGDTNYYGIDTVVQIDELTWQVTVQEVYAGTLAAGSTVRFYQRSAIIASAHTFEYVGAGTNPATALPQYGGIPIEANEVVQADGGRVTFTSTDHKGNFKIGANLVINQATGIINGDSFNRSMFALMTPYILALEG